MTSHAKLMVSTPDKITELLHAVSDSDRAAQQQLLEAVYQELHRIASARMAGESPDHTLQPTALINEAYPRLLSGQSLQWRDRGHFLGAAAEAMRRVLIDYARRKSRAKRGGNAQRVNLDADVVCTPDDSEQLLQLNNSLQKLEQTDGLRASVVKLKFFAGLSNSEVAEALGLPLRTVERHWTFARAWLRRDLDSDAPD